MDYYRIQDKMVSWQKLEKTLQKILRLREKGFSQQEVATRLGIDRTFISRLESIGELRKGKSIAFVGFPVLNKAELNALLEKEGADFIFIMTEKERLDFVNNRSGKEMVNEVMAIINRVRSYDVVICAGSDERLNLIEGMLDAQVITIGMGPSPLTEDHWVDPAQVKKILQTIKRARGS